MFPIRLSPRRLSSLGPSFQENPGVGGVAPSPGTVPHHTVSAEKMGRGRTKTTCIVKNRKARRPSWPRADCSHRSSQGDKDVGKRDKELAGRWWENTPHRGKPGKRSCPGPSGRALCTASEARRPAGPGKAERPGASSTCAPGRSGHTRVRVCFLSGHFQAPVFSSHLSRLPKLSKVWGFFQRTRIRRGPLGSYLIFKCKKKGN